MTTPSGARESHSNSYLSPVTPFTSQLILAQLPFSEITSEEEFVSFYLAKSQGLSPLTFRTAFRYRPIIAITFLTSIPATSTRSSTSSESLLLQSRLLVKLDPRIPLCRLKVENAKSVPSPKGQPLQKPQRSPVTRLITRPPSSAVLPSYPSAPSLPYQCTEQELNALTRNLSRHGRPSRLHDTAPGPFNGTSTYIRIRRPRFFLAPVHSPSPLRYRA
jgi:hypothetical protein